MSQTILSGIIFLKIQTILRNTNISILSSPVFRSVNMSINDKHDPVKKLSLIVDFAKLHECGKHLFTYV